MPASEALRSLVLAALTMAVVASCSGGGVDGEKTVRPELCNESPGILYEKRVAPLFSADRPSTCAQCHAGGIDLEKLMREDPCESMACLQAEGLVNLDFPERSVILAWIDRAQPDSNLITPEIIEEEHDGFLSWIEHESLCRSCTDAVCTGRPASLCESDAKLGGSFDLLSDPGDCESETLERLFRGTVYESRSRCSPCHFQEEESADPRAPRWLHRTGNCTVASLATYRAVIDSGYIDVDSPEESLLLLKPLAEAEGGIPHGGHDKFGNVEEDTYQAYLHFVERYSSCKTDSSTQ